MAILLGTHTDAKPIHFRGGLIFLSLLDSENCNITVEDGVHSFDREDVASPGIKLGFKGKWFLNSHHGCASLGSGTLNLYVKKRSEERKDYFSLLDPLQNFYIYLDRADDGDDLHGELIVAPSKWEQFIKSLALINEKSLAIEFRDVLACSPWL